MMAYVRRNARYTGLGITGPQVAGIGAGAAAIASSLLSTAPISSKVESSVAGGLFATAPFTGPAAPFVAAAGVVAELLSVFGVGSGCGQTCVISTAYANKAEAALQANLQQYFSLPSPRTDAQKAWFLSLFDTVWSDMAQQCNNPSLGSAGRRCITDRQSGACVWKQTSGSPLLQYPGEPQPGACWNWFSGYRDPIANDVTVSDTSSVGAAATSAATALSSVAASLNISPIWLAVGLGLVVWGAVS